MSRGWSKFPHVLIDNVMSRLRDTEWRLLCIIVRETIGRIDAEGMRQKRAWLSQHMLKKRTGRESAAISRAIDVLCLSGLIEVRDALGQPLTSSRRRRSYQGRMRFSLNADILGEIRQK